MSKLILLLALLFSAVSNAAVYGQDSRKDISNLPKKWQTIAQSVALALPTHYLKERDDHHLFHLEYNERNYSEEVGVCKKERFSNQKTFGHCTAFLVHPKLLVSAGHCLLPTGTIENQAHSYCENFSFWFGYNDEKQKVADLGRIIPKKDVVHCKKVIFATNNQKTDPNDQPVDFVIYELDKPVLDREPLSLAQTEPNIGEVLTTVGHPHGLPAKHAGYTPLRKTYPTVLSANLDTLSGNSGGPAFNFNGDVVGILIAGHQFDSYEDKKLGCDRINRCNEQGRSCNIDSDLETSNLLLKNEVWLPYVEKYLEANPQEILLTEEQSARSTHL